MTRFGLIGFGVLVTLGASAFAAELLTETLDEDSGAFICTYGTPAGYDEEGFWQDAQPSFRVVQADPCECTYGDMELIDESRTGLAAVEVEAERAPMGF